MAYPPADRHRPRPDEPTGVTTRPTRRPSPRPTRSPPTATHNPPGSPTPASPHAHAPHEGASKIGPSLHPPLRTEPPSNPGRFKVLTDGSGERLAQCIQVGHGVG